MASDEKQNGLKGMMKDVIDQILPPNEVELNSIKEEIWSDLSALYYKYEDEEQKRAFREVMHEICDKIEKRTMTDLELIFSMLGEASTTQITRVEHPDGFEDNKEVARRGGNVAGLARKKLEKETKRKVTTRQNYLVKQQNKRLKNK